VGDMISTLFLLSTPGKLQPAEAWNLAYILVCQISGFSRLWVQQTKPAQGALAYLHVLFVMTTMSIYFSFEW